MVTRPDIREGEMVVIDGQQRITTTCILLIELKRAINNFIASKSRQNCQKLDLLTKAKEDIDSVLFMQKGPMLNMQTLEEGDDIKVRGVGQRVRQRLPNFGVVGNKCVGFFFRNTILVCISCS